MPKRSHSSGRKLAFTRGRLLEMARLHHILFTLSHLYYPSASPLGTWSGTPKAGSYLRENGEGDRLYLVWTSRALVGLVFAHESKRSAWKVDEDARTPLAHLPGLPRALVRLATKVAADVENLATAGLWSEGDAITLSDPLGARDVATHGLEMIAGMALTPDEAVLGDALTQSWRELSSLTEPQARLAIRLAVAANGSATKVDAAGQDVLLTPPEKGRTIDLAAARDVKKTLAEVGIAWTIPRARIEAQLAANTERKRARVARSVPATDQALFEAVRANDPARAASLIAGGADVNARTVKGQWEYTPAGDTPIIQAFKAGASKTALVLLHAGADVIMVNSFRQNALHWAARKNDRAGVEACLASPMGKRAVVLGDGDGQTPLHHAAHEGNREIVDLLLAAGAPIAARTKRGRTAADWASMAGHHALAARLTP